MRVIIPPMTESAISSKQDTQNKAWNPFVLLWWSICFSSFAGTLLLADQFSKLGHPENKNKCFLLSGILGISFLAGALLGLDYVLLTGANILVSFFLVAWQQKSFVNFKNRAGSTSFWLKPALQSFTVGLLFMGLLVSIQETQQSLHYRAYEKVLFEAQQYREDGDLTAGEEKLKELIGKNPDEPAAYIELSYVYEDMGVLESALKQSELALGKTKRALSRGNLFLNRLRLLNWKQTLEQRIEDLPLAIEGQEAIRIWSAGDRESALTKLQDLQKKYPTAYQPHAALAFLYKNTGDAEKCIEEARAAMRKIDAKLVSKKMNKKMKLLIEQDRANLQTLIDELQAFYEEA